MIVLAHGVGSRGDLPIPFWQFAWAAVAALAISFLALAALWKEPRLAAASDGRRFPLPSAATATGALVGRVIAFAMFFLVIAAALFGIDHVRANIAPVTIYVVFWVGLQMTAAIIGDVWTRLSPFDTLVSAAGGSAERGSPPAWSLWWAPVSLFGFLFLELVHPSGSTPLVLGVAALVYTAVTLAGGVRWGRAWVHEAAGFSSLFRMLGAMAPFFRDVDDRLRWRLPFTGLASLQMTAPWLAAVLITLGATSFDGLAESELWTDLFGRQDGWDGAILSLLGLLFSIGLVSALFEFGVRFAALTTDNDFQPMRLAFAPSLIPIVFGYTLAHYAQLLLDEFQTFTFRLSDPFGRGWDLFGTTANTVNYDILSPTAIGWIQVLAIVLGHVVAVVVAHDRGLERFGERGARESQYAMLFVMVIYSVGGLWLLMNA